MTTILSPNPTKAAELAHLGQFVSALPDSSYLSGILRGLYPEIERAIRSDIGFIERDYSAAAAELETVRKQLAADRAELAETVAIIADNRRQLGRLYRDIADVDSAARAAARDTAAALGRAAAVAAGRPISAAYKVR